MIAAALLAATAAPQTLRVMTHERWFSGWSALEEVAREFERAHPGVRVELLSSAGGAGSRDKVKFALAGEVPLDVVWIDVTEFPAFLADGALVDLQPLLDADPAWDAAAYFPQILDGMRAPDGHLFGLPSTFNPLVMYVNLDLLAEAGLPRPPDDWSWEDLERYARATTRDRDRDGRTDQWGIAITQWLQAFAPWVWQNGGRFVDEQGRVALDEPAAAEAFAFLQRLLHEEEIASDDATFANQMSVGLFQAGRVAFHGPAGYWETYRFREIRDFAWDYHPLPRGAGGAATTAALRFYCVPRTARDPALACAFVRALAGPQMQRALARIGNGVPGLIAAARSDDFLDPAAGRRTRLFLDVLPQLRWLPPGVDWAEAQTLAGPIFDQALLLDRIPAAEAARRATAAIEAARARRAGLAARPRLPVGAWAAAWAIGPLALLAWLGARLRRRAPRLARREERAAWGFLAPWALGCAALLLGPALVLALLAAAEWSPVQPLAEARWVGADGFRALAHDAVLGESLRATALYAALAVPLQLAVALGLALLLERPARGVGLARTILYLPTVLSPVVLGAVWRWILDARAGLLNQGLAAAGVAGPDWLGDPDWVVPAFVLMSLWTVGAQMLVFLAGLQAVDPAQREAARLDGARPLQVLRHVTLPALSPVILFNLVVGLIGAFQVFAQPFVMTQGGPGNESRFLALHLWEQAFRALRFGHAAALSWLLFGIVLAATLLVLRGTRRWVHYAGAAR